MLAFPHFGESGSDGGKRIGRQVFIDFEGIEIGFFKLPAFVGNFGVRGKKIIFFDFSNLGIRVGTMDSLFNKIFKFGEGPNVKFDVLLTGNDFKGDG
jgi:hypothetical protein